MGIPVCIRSLMQVWQLHICLNLSPAFFGGKAAFSSLESTLNTGQCLYQWPYQDGCLSCTIGVLCMMTSRISSGFIQACCWVHRSLGCLIPSSIPYHFWVGSQPPNDSFLIYYSNLVSCSSLNLDRFWSVSTKLNLFLSPDIVSLYYIDSDREGIAEAYLTNQLCLLLL